MALRNSLSSSSFRPKAGCFLPPALSPRVQSPYHSFDAPFPPRAGVGRPASLSTADLATLARVLLRVPSFSEIGTIIITQGNDDESAAPAAIADSPILVRLNVVACHHEPLRPFPSVCIFSEYAASVKRRSAALPSRDSLESLTAPLSSRLATVYG